MGANLSKILVVDIESTCWETPEEQGTSPSEVIEIGICEIGVKSTVIRNKRSYVVRPQFSKVSPFCTRLTGWTQEAIDAGQPLEMVLRQITSDFGISRHHVWCSFGEYDRIMLADKMPKLYKLDNNTNPFAFMRAHFNVKTLLALREGHDHEMGMARALSYYGEDLEGRHHNGADDAYNIAKIARRVILNATQWKGSAEARVS